VVTRLIQNALQPNTITNRQDNMSEQQNNGQRRNQGGNNRNRNRNNNRNFKKREPKPLPLTGWQKFLIAIKVTSEDKIRAKQKAANKSNTQQNTAKKNANNSNAKQGNNANRNNKPNGQRNSKPRRAPEKVPVESPRLYVGNLSYDASESDLEELFKGIGNVKTVEIIYNRHTHRSKGYGFVQMLNVDDAKRAVEVLHDQPFLGRNMIVNGSKARNPSDPKAQAKNSEDSETSAA